MDTKKPIQTFRDLQVYGLAHQLAMKIFWISTHFSIEEKYSLTDQIRRSSRSIAVNIAEGWGKRRFENTFKKHLIDSIGSLEETKSWLLFSLDCLYINQELFNELTSELEKLGAKLSKLHENWKTF
jgi:four helix bundle protein